MFRITVHRREGIVEVRYPAHPTRDAVAEYVKQFREAIHALGERWHCLVDQRAITVLPPEVAAMVSELNQWAVEHGMERTARVLKPSAISEMQARRILREGGLENRGALFESRDEAWAALTSSGSASSRSV